MIVSGFWVRGPGFDGVLHGLLSAGVVVFYGVGCLVGVVLLVASWGLAAVLLGVLGSSGVGVLVWVYLGCVGPSVSSVGRGNGPSVVGGSLWFLKKRRAPKGVNEIVGDSLFTSCQESIFEI